MNAVDERIRRTFESDWLRGSRGDIADYLPAPDAPSFLATLEELICIDLEFRWMQVTPARGDGSDVMVASATLASRPVVEDYLERFPQLKTPVILQRLVDQEIWARKDSPFPPNKEEYQQRFPQLGLPPSTFRRMLGNSLAETQRLEGIPMFASHDVYPRMFGNYELLELLGRGGMGMVYRARQTKAERMVAMKVANTSKMSAELRQEIQQRFEAEVRAAARLSHDNLMPVHDVGEVDECLYYTMPIVDGDLAAEVKRQPLSNARAAGYLSQAARGVAVAHQQGLLHRDIKPHNLMLDRKLDRVLVADFGLARLMIVEQQLTLTGQIVGTPPYMAAEQIRDPSAIDARADIYSLGATLYHLLVGRPPFQAATATETMRQVMEDDPVSPRLINSQVDLDLETICLRCLQKDPQLRFSSATELADDLDRYLHGEPIVSRPLGTVGRLIRWRRRNPIVAALTAGLLASLILVALVASCGWYSTQRQLGRVVANSRQGQAAVNDLFTFVRTEPLLDQPGQESIRHYLLDRGLKHFESLVTLADENKTLPSDLIAARKELGLLLLELRGPNEAVDQFQKVIAAAAQLPVESQESLAVRETLGDSWNGLGQSRHRLGMEKEAIAAFQQAIDIRQRIVVQVVQHREAKRKLANAIMNHALVTAARGEIEESRAKQEQAQRQRQELLALDAADPHLLRDLAQGEFNLARLDLTGSQPKAGLARLHDATNRFEKLTREFPTDARIWQRYIECLLTLSIHDNTSPNQPYIEKAINYLQPLASLAPENRTYRLRLIELYQQAIEQLLSTSRAAQAESPWRTMQTQLIDRLDDSDTQPDAIRARLIALRQRGLISLGMGNRADAKRQLQAALAAWQLAKSTPQGTVVRTARWDQDWESLQQLADSL